MFRCGIAIDVPPDLRSRLNGPAGPPECLELESPSSESPPAPRAAIYRKIAEFLNARLSDDGVKFGATKEVP